MLGWFRPKCPIGVEDQRWIDHRMAWLVEQFGADRIRKGEVILPTADYFPEEYLGSEEDLDVLLYRVCRYMGIEPRRVGLAVYSEDRPVAIGTHVIDVEGGSAGLYEEQEGEITVWLEGSRLDDPAAVVATMAHELAHSRLLGEGRIGPEAEDQEPLTDLLCVFLGLGIFTANAVLHESHWEGGGWHGWKVGRTGYLTAPLFGYALARFAWYREEHRPGWARYLRPDVRTPLDRALRYLAKSGNEPAVEPAAAPAYPPGAFRPPRRSEPDPARRRDEGGNEELDLPPCAADACVLRGVLHFNDQSYGNALEEFNEAIGLRPDDAELFQLRASTHFHLTQFSQAIDDCTEAIRLDAEDLKSYVLRGAAHFHLGQHDRAIADLDHVLGETSDMAEAFYWRGCVRAALDCCEEAVADCRQAIRLAPNEARYYLARAEAYDRLGRADKAEADRQEALRCSER